MSENKIPNPLATNENTVAILELRINANMPVIIISATATQRIVIVGSGLLIAVLCGTSRIETKHKASAKAPVMPIVTLDAMMPNRYSAKPRFGLIREMRFAGFGLCGCNRPRYEEMTIRRFGLIREGGFGTWHRPLGVGVAPHLEQCGLPGLN